MANYIESQLHMPDGAQLFVRDWLNVDSQHDTPIIILHGMAEHCGRYDHIANFLNACGFAVRTYDHRGHGKSSGARGDIPHPTSLIDDAEIVIQDFAQTCQSSPLLFGHSMGGLLAARVACATSIPLRGLILSSPALALRLNFIEQFSLKLLSQLVPHLSVPFKVKPEYLSHQLAVFVKYINDPLVHSKITPILVSSMISAIEFTQAHAAKLAIPVLLLVAGDDKLVNPQGSYDFLDRIPKQLATAHFYSDYYHEIFNEIGAEQVFMDLKNWLGANRFCS